METQVEVDAPFVSPRKAEEEHLRRVHDLFEFMMDKTDQHGRPREPAFADLRQIANDPELSQKAYDELSGPATS